MAAAVIFAATGLALAGWGRPELSVDPASDVGGDVAWVLPGSPAWADGIRPGQRVIGLTAGMDPTAWRIETTSTGGTTFASSYAAAMARLRMAVWPGVAAVALAGFAWVALRRFWLAVGLSVVSLAVSSHVLMLSGSAVLGTAGVVALMLGLATWLAGSDILGGDLRKLACLIAVALAAGWVGARHIAPPLFDAADVAVDGATAAGVFGIAISTARRKRWRGVLLTLDSARVADLVALATVLATSVFAALILEGPLLLLVALGLGAVFLYPRFRRRIGLAVDQVLLADIRSRASLTAVEEERGRIARDLHDEPLQEIAAAIRLLDERHDTRKESELLRRAAGHLRRVTTELRPPVLDDLGLAASIAFVADQALADGSGVKIDLLVEPDDVLGDRPPPDVELAVFRIVQEAVDNALRHSAAGVIRIRAFVTPTKVTASIQDDGVGLAPGAAREALLQGHLGLVSMAQRASHIGATFEVGRAQPRGTAVSVRWSHRG